MLIDVNHHFKTNINIQVDQNLQYEYILKVILKMHMLILQTTLLVKYIVEKNTQFSMRNIQKSCFNV